MLQRKTTRRTSEGNLDRVNREPINARRELVGLVGGKHESVIEIDQTRVYCSAFNDFRGRHNLCDTCPLKAEGKQ